MVDFSPLRQDRASRAAVAAALTCAVHEVDAHNVVPVWEASDHVEYAARTIRPKIHRRLFSFLTEFPDLHPPTTPWEGPLLIQTYGGERRPIEGDGAADHGAAIAWDRVLHTCVRCQTPHLISTLHIASPTTFHFLRSLDVDRSVGEVDWATPGEAAAKTALDAFIARRLPGYSKERNNPVKKHQSNVRAGKG